MFNNKTILVTGGTGSFGKHFISHLLENYTPKKIIVFSRDELKQFEMGQVDPFRKHADKIFFALGNIRDLNRLMQTFEGVDYVIHAAALKHIRTGEQQAEECVKNQYYWYNECH